MPLSSQELAKRLGNKFGSWVDPDRNGLYDDEGQMYIDPDVTWKQELGRVLVQTLGLSSYQPSVQREEELARDKVALEDFGAMYNDLAMRDRSAVAGIVEDMDYFKGKRERLAKSGMVDGRHRYLHLAHQS